jgi:hypothetical protein
MGQGVLFIRVSRLERGRDAEASTAYTTRCVNFNFVVGTLATLHLVSHKLKDIYRRRQRVLRCILRMPRILRHHFILTHRDRSSAIPASNVVIAFPHPPPPSSTLVWILGDTSPQTVWLPVNPSPSARPPVCSR